MQRVGPILARVLLSTIFIISGVEKFMAPGKTAAFMQAHAVPAAGALVFVVALIEVVGGVSVLLGASARWGALLLFLYLIPVTLVMHNPAQSAQMVSFLKNLAIMGGLLMVTLYGLGRPSLDYR